MIDPEPRTRLSMTAAASLVCGMLGIFVLPAILAIITGIIGLRRTRQPGVTGRGVAIGGIVLGCVLGPVGVGVGVLGYQWYTWGMDQVRLRTPAVVNAIIDGSATGGEYSNMSLAAVDAVRQKTAGWGRMTEIPKLRMTGEKVEGNPDQMRLAGEANFDKAGLKPFRIVIEAKDNDIQVVDVVFD